MEFKESWSQFIEGNHDALHLLYKQHYLGLVNYGIKLTGDRQYANDCIIEMLLGLWEKRDKLPAVDNVRSYLLTCLRTVIFQKMRSEKLREAKEGHAHSLIDQQELSYEEYLTKCQTDAIIKAKLSKSLGKLTERQKELLQYKFFDNMDYDDIAEKCNISKRTAYNIVYDALKLLKEDLKRNGTTNPLYLLSIIAIFTLAFT
ncbi:RNA polymerase sigma factor [Mucilaginibacter paludis]|nr:sigma-70 family RNA polymerase sigma factor [Mucilaginibacter paludis]